MATTSANSHSHPVKIGTKTYTSGSIGHQHTFTETQHPADSLTDEQVAALVKLIPPPTTTPPPVVTPPPTTTPSGTLQQIIDGTQSGGSVDITGWTGSGSAVITKPITIKGGLLNSAGVDKAVIVNAKGVIFDSFGLDGGKTGYGGIWATHADGLQVVNCSIHDLVYAGVMVIESIGGQVSKNLIQRIGVGGVDGANAYGIAFTDLGGPATADFIADSNVVEDVPTWEGIDTHNGLRLTWTNNIVRRARRPYWINAAGGKRPGSCVVKGNRAEQVPQPVFDPLAYLVQQSDNCQIINNSQSLDYPVGAEGGEWHNYVRDYGGLSTGLICTGNTRS